MRAHLSVFALPLVWLAACGDSSSPGNDSGTGGVATTGGATTGGSPTGGKAATPTGGTSGAGASPTGGRATGGDGSNQGGKSGSTGGSSTSGGAPASGGTTSGAGGTGTDAGTSGMPAAGGGQGGAPSTGGGGGDAGGSGGGGGSGPTACTRELLDSTIDAYFKALAAGDPSSLPLADDVRFTENGAELELGAAGLWKSAGEVKYTQSALDTEVCQSGTHAVVPDGSTDIPVALRLKLENGSITEIEMIAARAGDYPEVTANPGAIITMGANIGWEETVPEGERATREELTAWMDKYFRMFPNGVCNVTSACRRLENGGGDFMCGGPSTCAAGNPGPNNNVLESRLLFADVERGIGVGFTLFDFGGLGPMTDMHMFKMSGDQVHAVHAILADSNTTGWD